MLSNRRRMAVCVAVVLLLYSPRLMAQDARAERDAPAQTGVSSSPSKPSRERPFALKALYVSLAALEALDVHSTVRAIERGGREINPIVRALHDSPTSLAVLKGASFVSAVHFSERLREEHPKAALVTMIGLNAAYCFVVVHNYGIAGR